jgi:nucleoside-diphosphate-sugar epimerase
MLVAVTGASGFLGRKTLVELRRQGHVARALLRKRPQDPVPAEECVFGNQDEPSVQAELVRGAEAVVHIGMDWKALNDGPRANFDRNLAGTLQLLEAAREADVGQFVFVSSLDVYGGDAARCPRPSSIYAAFKFAVEVHLSAYHASFGMNTSAWRPAAMYGIKPGLEQSLWLDVVRRVRHGETIDEPTTADVVCVDDVARALALAIGDPSVAGEIFDLVDVRVGWPEIAAISRQIIKNPGKSVDLPQSLEHVFDPSKAIAFFDRHGDHQAMRRGLAGVTDYLKALLAEEAAQKPRGSA